jgi:uncharacterized protein
MTGFVLLAAVVAIAAFVQGTVGIGFALIVAPVLGLLRPQLLPTSLLLLMLPLNLFSVLRERRALDWAGASWITFGRVVGTVIGAGVLTALSAHTLDAFVGGAIILAAATTWFMPVFRPQRKALITVGLLTGITETATGVGGPPLALAYQHHPPKVFRATVAACFLAGELLSLLILAAIGRTGHDQITAAALLLPFLAVGAVLSSAVRHRINVRFLRNFVLVFALTSGVVLLFRG